MRSDLCRLLRCPECKRGSLTPSEPQGNSISRGDLGCQLCNARFSLEDGAPIFLPKSVRASSSDVAFSALDEATKQKVLQREWHDKTYIATDDKYKRSAFTDQGLFAFLLHYQLREVKKLLAGTRYPRIANIGCGHGFEIDFLAELGSSVILVDISPKSLEKACAKAEKIGIRVDALCCDAENLPLQDNSVDLVLTHHSLHHLANPMIGLREMIRVAKSRIAFFEPAKGIGRRLVRAFGLKPEVEESGNAVYEFGQSEVRDVCEGTGAEILYFRKCLITGPTCEPRIFAQLDAHGASAVLCSSIALGNRLFGGLIGTKCSVVLAKANHEAANIG